MNLTARQERFCLLIVKGETQSRAYELAGYSTKSPNALAVKASELVRLPNVAQRIAELQGRAAEKTLVTVESLTAVLFRNAQLAEKDKQYAAVNSAVGLIAKMHGLVIDKSEQVVMHRPAPLPTKILELSEADWLRQFSRAGEKLKRIG